MTAELLRANLEQVRARIERAGERARRDPAEVEILPVTKTVDVGRLREALSLGLTRFGENRVQEAEQKAPELTGATWQMIGRLQSNKAARAVELFEVIHSVDSVALAERIGRHAIEQDRAPYPIYVQINIDADPAKAGFAPTDFPTAAVQISGHDALDIRGLMTVGHLGASAEEARPTFRALRELSEGVRARVPGIGPGLSMGMSDDFEIAVEEGATVVRLGRVLFGDRPSA